MKGWRSRSILVALLGLLALRPAYAGIHFGHTDEEDPDAPKWEEGEMTLPDFPKDEDLLEFYVSGGTANRFYVDGKSISPGADGVIRFTMVVKTAGGATNVTYEGIRCSMLETRLYAIGLNGKWVLARDSKWKAIVNHPVNRQHAALNRDYFCPSTLPIQTAEEGRDALRRGKHPNAK